MRKYFHKIIFLIFFIIIMIIIMPDAGKCENNIFVKLSDINNQRELLEDYKNIALKNNFKIIKLVSELKAARAEITSSGILMDPVFSYNYNISDIDQRKHKFLLSQEFPLTSKLKLEKKITEFKADEFLQMLETEKRKLIFQIKNIYFDIYYLIKQRKLTFENIELLKSIAAVLSAKYKTAKSNYADLIQIQIQIDELSNDFEVYGEMLKPLVYKFNKLLNRNDSESIILPITLDVNKINYSEEEMQKMVLESNPEIKAYYFKIESASAKIELANKEYVPDLMAGLEYETMKAEEDGEMLSADQTENTLTLMFSIKLPVWRKKLSAMVDERKNMKEALEAERLDISNELLSQLKNAVSNLAISEKKIKLYQDSIIPKSQQAIEIIKNDYITNKADFKDLIENFKIYLEFNIMFEQMKTEYNKMLAEIEMLLGN